MIHGKEVAPPLDVSGFNPNLLSNYRRYMSYFRNGHGRCTETTLWTCKAIIEELSRSIFFETKLSFPEVRHNYKFLVKGLYNEEMIIDFNQQYKDVCKGLIPCGDLIPVDLKRFDVQYHDAIWGL